MNNFWQNLSKPILCLAPMEDVTDAAFRRVIAAVGKPDVLFTEFTSCDGLLSVGKNHLLHRLLFDETERPIVAQLFTSKPKNMEACAQMVAEMGFDGIDINMGCPDKAIIRQGCGSALIREPKLAQEIVRAAKKGAGDLPISVKTRTGYSVATVDTWIPALLEADPAAIILHGRTKKEMSKVPASWGTIGEAAAIVHASGTKTLIIGNGDVMSPEDAQRKAADYELDGVMMGRAIFGNPWLFANRGNIGFAERINVLIQHITLYEQLLGKTKNFANMRKHFSSYIAGFPQAKELRSRLMECHNAAEAIATLRHYVSSSTSSFLNNEEL